MGVKQRLKNLPRVYTWLLRILNRLDYFNIRFRHFFPSYQLTDTWKQRIELVRESPDNERIDHGQDSGRIFHDYQIMHNGLKIVLGSYYDYGNAMLLQENQGIHEPQEEFAFQEVLKSSMHDGATMMELGSYWAFYSMWFASRVKEATCIMVEPDPHKLNFGRLNFRLNQLKGQFELGFIAEATDLKRRIPSYTVDDLAEKYAIKCIDILHSDIQGFELKMLRGATQVLAANRVGYVFISTHSNELHNQCEAFLKERTFVTVCSANLNESFSWDGLLVMKRGDYPGIDQIAIAKR